MAISNLLKYKLDHFCSLFRKAQVGTVIQNLQNGVGQDLERGKILRGDSAGASEEYVASGDGKILVGDGTDVVSVAVSGDVALDNTGAVTIQAGAVEEAMIGAGEVAETKLATGIIVGKSADDAKTTSREENVAGLSSLLTLANDIKAKINLHYADQGVGGEEHIAADSAIVSPDADSIASAVTLISEIQDSYVAHDDDAILAAAWVYHQAQGTERALASEVNPTNLQTCITVANDIKAKLDLHMADATAHTAGDSTSVAAADAAYGAAISVVDANVSSGDLVSWSILNSGTGTVVGVSAVAGSGVIVFTFDADPQNDAVISYMVLRTLA
jgi:hypothetical protein